jgi:hypothetical protein
MLIEFKIHVDGSGGVTAVPASANAVNPALPNEKVLGGTYRAAGATTTSPVATKGGSAPTDGPGAGMPTGSGSGSGNVFVIGPIVICGSVPGQTNAGGAAPTDGPGAGGPKTGSHTSASK